MISSVGIQNHCSLASSSYIYGSLAVNQKARQTLILIFFISHIDNVYNYPIHKLSSQYYFYLCDSMTDDFYLDRFTQRSAGLEYIRSVGNGRVGKSMDN